MRRSIALGIALLLVAPAVAAAGPLGTVTVDVSAGEYRFVETADGDRIEMDGFGWLQAPGRPLVPERRLMLLLPPGARPVSVVATPAGSRELPDRRRLAPAGPIIPTTGTLGAAGQESLAEWTAAVTASYATDASYPADIVRIVGSGTIRKYAYVMVSFRPVQYAALSGSLTLHDRVHVTVEYELPTPGSAEAHHVEALRWDMAADARAAEVFSNWSEMSGAYVTPAAPPAVAETHDYVIVTRDDLVTAIVDSGFLEWKAALGYDVAIVTTTDALITGQPGLDLGEQIRNFLRAHYGPWGIRWVLLVGKHSTIPMRYCFPDPTRHQHNPTNPANPGGSIPTDHYYADLSLPDAASWDLDGDGYYGEWAEDAPDLLPEIAVGRIPTDAPVWITGALAKSVRFEQDTGAWKDQALHAGAILFYENQDHMAIPFRDGAVCLDVSETAFAGAMTVDRYSEHDGLVPSTYPWLPISQAAFTSAWRNGRYGVVNWAGHGSPDGAWRMVWTWDDGDGVFETDGSDGVWYEAFVADWVLLDDDDPSIVFAVSCNVGYPEPNGTGRLGVDLIAKPGLGAAVGVAASSRVAYVTANWPTQPGGAESFCCEFNRYLVAVDGGTGERVGDALYDAKAYCHVNFGWTTFREYWDQFDYNLYGDPALVRSGVDVAVSVASGDPVPEPAIGPRARPNPFSTDTEIVYTLASGRPVRIEVFDVQGRRLAVPVDGHRSAGLQRDRWDGRTDAGVECPPGLYFLRLESNGQTWSRKVVRLR